MFKRKLSQDCSVQFKEICVERETLSDGEKNENSSLEEIGKPDDSVDGLNRALYLPPNEFDIESHTNCSKKKKNVWVPKRLYQCLSCSHKTNKRSNMTDHLKIHTPPTDMEWFSCGLCAYKAKHKRSINRHQQKVHKNHNIISLDKLDTPESDMKVKTKEAHEFSSNEDKFKQEPSTIVPGIVVYQEHCTLETLEAEADDRRLTGKFDCDQIGYIETIIERRNMNYQGAIYQCQSCPYSSKKKSNMRDHVVKHKPLAEIDWYTCSQCKYQTKHKRSITRHIETVHKFEQDECEILLRRVRTNTESIIENECDEGFIELKKDSRLELISGIVATQRDISNRRNKKHSKFNVRVEYQDPSNQEFIEIKAEAQSNGDQLEKVEDERDDPFENDCDRPQYVDLPELQDVHIKNEDFDYAEASLEKKFLM